MKRISPLSSTAVLATFACGVMLSAVAANAAGSAPRRADLAEDMLPLPDRVVKRDLQKSAKARPVMDRIAGRTGKAPAASGVRGGAPATNQSTSPIPSPLNLNANPFWPTTTPDGNIGGAFLFYFDEFQYNSDTTGNLMPFATAASNITTTNSALAGTNRGQAAADWQAYLYNRTTSDAVLVTKASGGTGLGRFRPRYNFASGCPRVSADGNIVAYSTTASYANNLTGTTTTYNDPSAIWRPIVDGNGVPKPSANPTATTFPDNFSPMIYRYNVSADRMDVVSVVPGQEGYGQMAALHGTMASFGNTGYSSVDISNDGNVVVYVLSAFPGMTNAALWNPVGGGVDVNDTINTNPTASAAPTYVFRAVFADGNDTAPDVRIASVTPGGDLPHDGAGIAPADANIFQAKVSGDGRYVMFGSNSVLLDPAGTTDVNAFGTPFVKDALLLSGASNGGTLARADRHPGTSAYGNGQMLSLHVAKGATPYMVFDNSSNNLLSTTNQSGEADPLDNNFNVYRQNAASIAAGITTDLVQVNLRDDDTEMGGPGVDARDAVYPSISPNGNFVAFFSSYDDASEGDANGDFDVYIRDVTAGTTRLWSTSSITGLQTIFGPTGGSMLNDGETFAMLTQDASLDPAFATTAYYQLYFQSGVGTGAASPTTTRLVSDPTGIAGVFNAPSYAPSTSGDGTTLAFTSYATNIPVDADGNTTLDPDTNSNPDVYVKDVTTANSNYELVSVAFGGGFGDSASGGVTSPDFAFTVDDPFNSSGSIADRGDSDTSSAYFGQIFSNSTGGDGNRVVFTSASSNLLDSGGTVGDTNGFFDVYIRNRATDTTSLVSVNTAGTDSATGSSINARISGNGNYVAFMSTAEDLAPDANGNFIADGNTNWHIYRRDLVNNTTRMIDVKTDGNPADTSSANPDISDSGRFVVFQASEPQSYPGSAAGASGQNLAQYFQIVRADVPSGSGVPTFALASKFLSGAANAPYFAGDPDNRVSGTPVSKTGRPGDWHSTYPRVSPDGSKVVFHTACDWLGLSTGDTSATYGNPAFTPDGGFAGADFISNSNTYMYDFNANAITLISGRSGAKGKVVDNAGANAGEIGSGFAEFSRDGNRVTFFSYAENLLDPSSALGAILLGDETVVAASQGAVYSYEIATGTNFILSVSDDGAVPMGNAIPGSEQLGSVSGVLPVSADSAGSFAAMGTNDASTDQDLTDTAGIRDIVTWGVPGVTPTPPTSVESSWDLYSNN